MRRVRWLTSLATLAVIVLLIMLVACSTSSPDLLNVDGEGNTSIDNDALTATINETSATVLSDLEKQGILYMREEEKLARDVYLQLYDKWGVNSFNNISSSEQTHMDAMKSLIDRYNLDDPAEGRGPGEFTNKELQQLYDDLIKQGSQSDIDALKVGAAIEEIDILDIEMYVAQTDKSDIKLVYENLLKGSRNHLRSFVSVMQKRGIVYQPQYITTERYSEIVGSAIEKG
ncbi:MAG: DUF2202 domain-containing protein [Chloroflexota bacterium]|nr:DUF2202 domain-containing protein [Chloroflexota bacterium]